MSQELSQKTTTSQKQFRAAMRRLPTSVVVVSAVLDDAPIGMVVGTFSSVSMDPLLVGFFGDHRSSTLEPLLETDQWSFSLLAQDHSAVADNFRRPRAERFTDIAWSMSDHGTPVIDGAVLTIHGRQHSVQPAGDHCLVLAEVTHIETSPALCRPLVYFESRLTRLDPGHLVPGDSWQLGWSD